LLNILIIGNGQCGNRILDAINRDAFGTKSRFAKYLSHQKYKSNVQTIAINTAVNDLKEMNFTKAKDRIHTPHLHGVGANRNVGKHVFEDNKTLIMKNIQERGNFDVAFVITSASGGTGSSFTPMLIKELKQKCNYPIYAIVVLPFREEGTLYLQNAAFCLKDMRESGVDGIILADNQFLKQMGGNVESAYNGINDMIARRLLFLLDALDSEMMMVTDLGDFKTVMSGGAGVATIGFYEADSEMPIRSVIKKALSPEGLLFSTDAYQEASRSMIIIRGDRKYMSIDEVSSEVEQLSSSVGQVFKGIIVRNDELPQVLTVLTLESAVELEKLYAIAVEAINYERQKKERVDSMKEMDKAFSQIDGMDPSY
jgi:cell division GTPase FtsZ